MGYSTASAFVAEARNPRRRSESRPATGHRAHKALVAVGVQTDIRELRTAPEEAGSKSPERTRDKANEMAQIGSIGLSGRVSSGMGTGPLTRSSDGWRVHPGLSCASAPRFLALVTPSTTWNAGQYPPTTIVCGFRLP